MIARAAAMEGLRSHLTAPDWIALSAYLLLASLVAWLARGRRAADRNPFPGGRPVPWPLVSASLVVADLGTFSLLVLPGLVLSPAGDFTFLQWAAGALLARVGFAVFFVKAFYEGEISSPYEFLGGRIGPGARTLAMVLFTAGIVLSQCARLFLGASFLSAVTPLSFAGCLLFIVLLAAGWTLMGGVRSVIWTDGLLLGLLAAGACALLHRFTGSFEAGWDTLLTVAGRAEAFDGSVVDKLRLFNPDPDPALPFTLWVALLAVPFQGLAALGADQTWTQRILCCRVGSGARKAVLWSSAGALVTLLLLLVGAALFVSCRLHPPTDPVILRALEWSGGHPGNTAMVLPVWTVTALPPVFRGLVVAAILGTAVSGLGAGLAALAGCGRDAGRASSGRARVLIAVWALLLAGAALLLPGWGGIREVVMRPGAGPAMFSTGPILGMVLVVLLGLRGVGRARLFLGVVVSAALVLAVRADLWSPFVSNQVVESLAGFPLFEPAARPEGTLRPAFAVEWLWPLSVLIPLLAGWDFRRKRE